jgi:hypothetical protein
MWYGVKFSGEYKQGPIELNSENPGRWHMAHLYGWYTAHALHNSAFNQASVCLRLSGDEPNTKDTFSEKARQEHHTQDTLVRSKTRNPAYPWKGTVKARDDYELS